MKRVTLTIAPVALSVAMALNVAQAATSSDEEDSVYRWGRWEVLSPAAGQQDAPQVPSQVSQLSTNDYGKEFVLIEPEEPDPIPVDDEPVPVCTAGATCGFATRNIGLPRSTGEDAEINTFTVIETTSEDGDSI